MHGSGACKANPTSRSGSLALPYLNSCAFQRWLEGFAAACPASLHLLVLANGAGHKAKAVCWQGTLQDMVW
jgi:hypothetical protein